MDVERSPYNRLVLWRSGLSDSLSRMSGIAHRNTSQRKAATTLGGGKPRSIQGEPHTVIMRPVDEVQSLCHCCPQSREIYTVRPPF